ncbi:MAG TPA: hypothetical protein VFR02_06940 [bacterium]|nr:hypothetical protein [bacterium]
MRRFFFPFLFFFAWAPLAGAQVDPTDPIQTHWTTLGGMEYLRDGRSLDGAELEKIIDSAGDRQASALLQRSGSDETLGFFGLGGSVALSVLSLFFPNSHIHVVGLDISTPYLPLAVPGAVLGVAGGLLELEANTAKYAAVQRYTRLMRRPDPLTWGFSPDGQGLTLRVACAF